MLRFTGGQRAAWVTATGAAAALLVTGCTGSTPTTETPAPTANVTVWDWNAGEDYYKKAFGDLNTSQSAVKVNYQFQQGTTFGTTVQAAFQSGSAPDVFMGYFDTIPNLIAKDYVQPIGDPADPEVAAWMKTFPDGSFKENVHIFNGKVYSFPFNPQSTIYLYYNKKVLAEAGITTPPATWGQLRAQAKQVTDASGKKAYGMVTGGKDVWPWFLDVSYLAATAGACNAGVGGSLPMAFDYATGTYNPDNPATRAALQLWLDMKSDGSVLPGIDSLTDADAHAAFGNNKAAFMFSGSWTPSVLGSVAPNADFGVAAVPVPDTGRKGYDLVATGSSWVISSKTANKKAAFDVIKAMTTLQFQQGYVASGAGLSVFPAANTSDFLKGKGMLDVYNVAQQTTKPAPVLTPDAGKVGPKLSDPNYTAVIQSIWTGKTTIEAGLADLETRMNKELSAAVTAAGVSPDILKASTAGSCGSY